MSQGQHRNSNIIDGKRISLLVQDEVKMHVEQLKKEHRVEPGLAVLIIGDRTDSQVYVKHKVIACERCGVRSVKVELGKETTQEEAGRVVRELNQDPSIHGILVQLPIPEHLDEKALLGEISLEKDVDGFHPTNIGLLAMRDRKALAQPCTPSGVMEILRREKVETKGAKAVVVGRSNIVGVPMALLLLKANATVEVVHSQTPRTELENAVKSADILVVAAGKAGLVDGTWIKEGSVVIDVGMNSIPDASKKNGYRLVGDVQFEEAARRARLITPVPGGVGPMTVAMLMHNTVTLAATQSKVPIPMLKGDLV